MLDNVTSGNPDIAPDKSNNFSMTYDWSFSERGSLKVNLFHQWRQDVLEQIELIDDNGDVTGTGIGNAGSAKFWGVVTDINLPLDWILKDGLMEISHGYRDSSFKDPIIDDTRTINFYTPKWLNIKLRQDITEKQFSWGLYYWSDFIDTNHFVDEKETFTGNKRFGVFVETSRFFGLKTQLEIMNVNTGEFTRTRFLYDGNRDGNYQGSEIAYRQRKPEIKLSVWGTF